MIDWSLARQVARGIAGLQPAGDRAPFEKLSAPAAESEQLLAACPPEIDHRRARLPVLQRDPSWMEPVAQ